MTNIELLSEDQIITLKNNQETVLQMMQTYNDNSWFKVFFNDPHPFTKSKILLPDIEMKKSSKIEDQAQIDADNAILLHQNLKLTDSQAVDQRLWISLCFGQFYDYMRDRWSVKDKTKNLKEHWFDPHGRKNSLLFNGLAKLYRFAQMSYDPSLQNPYELTSFCFRNIAMVERLSFRTYSNSTTIRLAMIKAMKQFVDDGGVLQDKKVLNNILKYMSFLGGAYILDVFSEQELIDKIYLKLIDFYIKANPK